MAVCDAEGPGGSRDTWDSVHVPAAWSQGHVAGSPGLQRLSSE